MADLSPRWGQPSGLLGYPPPKDGAPAGGMTYGKAQDSMGTRPTANLVRNRSWAITTTNFRTCNLICDWACCLWRDGNRPSPAGTGRRAGGHWPPRTGESLVGGTPLPELADEAMTAVLVPLLTALERSIDDQPAPRDQSHLKCAL